MNDLSHIPVIGEQPQQPIQPTLEDMQRSAALQLAISSFGGTPSAVSDDSLIRRAKRIEEYLAGRAK